MIGDATPILAILVGYLVSVFMGDFVIRPIRNKMYEEFKQHSTPQQWRPRVVGWLERFLYTSTILFGFPEFIAIWLALKVAGQWDRWKLDIGSDATKGTDWARATYTVYLIGNGLSILFAGLGAVIVKEFDNITLRGWAIVLVVVSLLSIGYYMYIRNKVNKQLTELGKASTPQS
jgi:hypothetical protein